VTGPALPSAVAARHKRLLGRISSLMVPRLFLCLLLLTALPARAQFGPQGPPAVGTLIAAMAPVTEVSEFTGRIEAVQRVDIRARVTGYLQERRFVEGQEVKAGDVLFRLEQEPFEAALDQARASVASAQATLENARVALSRARELQQNGVGTRVALDDAQARERVGQATLLAARAQVRAADISLAYTTMAAPIAGRIGRATLTPGNVASPTLLEPLATIVSQDPMRVAFSVSARQALELRDRYQDRGGLAAVVVRVTLADGRRHTEQGKVEFVDTQVDRSTDTLLLRALIPNPARGAARAGDLGQRELVDGQFVTITLEGAAPVQAVTLPRAAVLQDQGGFFVFVLGEGNRAERRPVVLGRAIADQVVIERGVKPGETVIAEGVQRVRPGAPVNATPVNATPVSPNPVTPAPAGAARPG
jgi:membrane fusion protein (multidrug efflux system)